MEWGSEGRKFKSCRPDIAKGDKSSNWTYPLFVSVLARDSSGTCKLPAISAGLPPSFRELRMPVSKPTSPRHLSTLLYSEGEGQEDPPANGNV
jgi:hypothetical protein